MNFFSAVTKKVPLGKLVKSMKQANWNLFENSLEPVLVSDSSLSLLYANQAFSTLFDQSLRRLKSGRPLAEIFGLGWPILQKALETPSLWQDLTLKTSSGVDCEVSVYIEPWVGEVGQSGWLIFLHDSSLEQRLQQKYKLELQQKEQFIQKLDRKLFEVSFLLEVSSGLGREGETEQIVQWSLELVMERFAFTRGALLQLSGLEVKVVAQVGTPPWPKNKWEPLASASSANWIRIVTENKTTDQRELKGLLLFEKGANWLPENQNLLESAAQQLISRVEKDLLYSSSITDEKTSLYNHRFFQAALAKEFQRSKRTGQWFGLIIVDIDHFKKFNDQYGHQTGDEVLIHVAKTLKRCLRNSDTAARFGGEEFCVIAVDTTASGLSVVMERIRSEVAALKVLTGEHGPLSVTVSLGGVMMNSESTSGDELFSRADKALYAAKGKGRNCWILD